MQPESLAERLEEDVLESDASSYATAAADENASEIDSDLDDQGWEAQDTYVLLLILIPQVAKMAGRFCKFFIGSSSVVSSFIKRRLI